MVPRISGEATGEVSGVTADERGGRPLVGRLPAFRVGVPESVILRPPVLESDPGLRFDDQALAGLSGLPLRDLKKLDRFSILAVAGAETLLRRRFPLDEDFAGSCGVFIGNMTAGWTFTSRELTKLHAADGGPGEVSPYLATAWFPAAPQGQISIRFHLRGTGKTYAMDRTAGAEALAAAVEYVTRHPGASAIAGGVEAPVTDFVRAAFETPRTFEKRRLAEGCALALFGPEKPGEFAIEFRKLASIFRTPASASQLGSIVRQALMECGAEAVFASTESPLDTEACADAAKDRGHDFFPATGTADALAAESAATLLEAIRAVRESFQSVLVVCTGATNIILFSIKKCMPYFG